MVLFEGFALMAYTYDENIWITVGWFFLIFFAVALILLGMTIICRSTGRDSQRGDDLEATQREKTEVQGLPMVRTLSFKVANEEIGYY